MTSKGYAAAVMERVRRRPDGPPDLDRTLAQARDIMVRAVLEGHYETGEKAFDHGTDRTWWLDDWPVGEWVDGNEVFWGSGRKDIVALRIFDPNYRESIIWFVNSADRRLYEKKLEERRRPAKSQPEKDDVETPVASFFVAAGHDVRRQVQCDAGIVDIHVASAGIVVECKAGGSGSALVAAVNQLRRYAPHFRDHSLAVAVPSVNNDVEWLARMIRASGIRIIEVDKGIDL